MCGWMHLPRLIDKIRLHLAGKLPPDYQRNYGKGFDGLWLESAGIELDDLEKVVKESITDGQVADWIRRKVNKTEAEKQAHAEKMMSNPPADDVAGQARLRLRKEQAGLEKRDDIRTFVDFIDADEKRL